MASPVDDRDLSLLLLIRHFEEALLRLFEQGKVDGTTHTCLGQEYVPVAVTPLLTDEDYVFSNHRGHGHYLARFRDPVALLAEITGRSGGVSNGVGGSQHLHQDTYFSSGVLGESLPIAVGAALHLKRLGRGSVALAYVGDGAFGEGAVYEALNMAALWQLPLVVVVENNHIAQSTTTIQQLAGTVRGRAEAFGIAHHLVTAQDPVDVRAGLAPLFGPVRETGAPLVVEFDTVRLGPHSKGDDTRDADELRTLRTRDWYGRYARSIPDRFGPADRAAAAAVASAVAEVLARPLATGPAAW
jgi:pyruvate dehydrogenase E1 component alpha subunit